MSASTCASPASSPNNQRELERPDVIAGQEASADIGAGVDKRQRGEGSRTVQGRMSAFCSACAGSGLPRPADHDILVSVAAPALIGQPSELRRRPVVQLTGHSWHRIPNAVPGTGPPQRLRSAVDTAAWALLPAMRSTAIGGGFVPCSCKAGETPSVRQQRVTDNRGLLAGTADHDDGDAKVPGGGELAGGLPVAAVLCRQHVDPLLSHQQVFAVSAVGSAGYPPVHPARRPRLPRRMPRLVGTSSSMICKNGIAGQSQVPCWRPPRPLFSRYAAGQKEDLPDRRDLGAR
jgi:hypothetical protein